ncbi:MAG: hypothetical protein JW891_12145 [Candidatus Lokiarchaeota archaeon]|nr:hypothetical protein [Candidatus Lokiarchaeota archaeon]
MKEAFRSGIPLFGVCLSMQLIAKIASGRIRKSPVREIGFKKGRAWYEIILTPDGREDPLFKGLPDKFPVFQLPGETAELSSNIKLLGKGEICLVQAIKIEPNNYGTQYHFALTNELLEEWIEKAPELNLMRSDDLREQYLVVKSKMREIGTRFFKNLLVQLEIL